MSDEYVPRLGDQVFYHDRDFGPVPALVVQLAKSVKGSDRGTLLTVFQPFNIRWIRSDPGPDVGYFMSRDAVIG